MQYNERNVSQKIVLEQIQFAARNHLDGHALHHLQIDEIPMYMADAICHQLSIWMMAEDLSPKPRRLNFFRPMDFKFLLKTSTPSSWWQHFKRDCMPEWFKKRWPVKYDVELHRRKTSTFVRMSGTVSFNVKAAYPKFPEVYPDPGAPKVFQECPQFSSSIDHYQVEPYESSKVKTLKGGVDGECIIKMDNGEVVQDGGSEIYSGTRPRKRRAVQ